MTEHLRRAARRAALRETSRRGPGGAPSSDSFAQGVLERPPWAPHHPRARGRLRLKTSVLDQRRSPTHRAQRPVQPVSSNQRSHPGHQPRSWVHQATCGPKRTEAARHGRHVQETTDGSFDPITAPSTELWRPSRQLELPRHRLGCRALSADHARRGQTPRKVDA